MGLAEERLEDAVACKDERRSTAPKVVGYELARRRLVPVKLNTTRALEAIRATARLSHLRHL